MYRGAPGFLLAGRNPKENLLYGYFGYELFVIISTSLWFSHFDL